MKHCDNNDNKAYNMLLIACLNGSLMLPTTLKHLGSKAYILSQLLQKIIKPLFTTSGRFM